ncbi:carboxypeptidase regulatory-like domain-containing protein [Chloroflexi bacterium TSY]|nr:carboxypeptidase regulatory-like domain-containing protein [Chloroflexi bacterium TSY]
MKVSVPTNGAATVDFGDKQTGIISGIVFVDINGDGEQDPSEVGLGGVVLVLLDPDGKVTKTTTTAGDGSYIFTDCGQSLNVQAVQAGLVAELRAPNANCVGDYTVQEVEPDGYVSTMPGQVDVTVPVGGSGRANFGDRLIGTISGVSFYDTDGDGIQDPNEAGISGVAIELIDNESHVIATTTTASDGTYGFPFVTPDTYTVHETDPFGYTNTTLNNVAVTVPANGAGSASFGNQQIGTVTGVVFNDVDSDGLQDGIEDGLGGVTIALLASNGIVIATTTTAGDGTYIFQNIVSGDYTMREIDPNGFLSTSPNNVVVTVPPKGAGAANFGDNLPVSISGVAFIDFGGDGVEQRLLTTLQPGVSVKLYDASSNQLDRTTTDTKGEYSFDNLPAGTYYLVFELPTDFSSFSPQDQGVNDNLDSDVNPAGRTVMVTIVAGGIVTGLDAGLVKATDIESSDEPEPLDMRLFLPLLSNNVEIRSGSLNPTTKH